MLQALRESSKSLFMKILLAILASTFVIFFGVSGNIGSGLFGNPNSLIEVGEVTYGQSAIARRYNQLANLYAQQLGGFASITPDLQRQILSQSVEAMVVEGLYQEATNELGLVASDALVAQQIMNEPGFQAGGEFNRIAFENYLLQTGQSETQYAVQLRQQIVIRDQYFGSLLGALQPPEILAEYLFQYQDEQRAAEIAIIDALVQGDVGSADAEQIAAYFDDNQERFRVPALRSATLMEVSVEAQAANIILADEEIAAEYAEREHEFLVPAVREIEQAMFADEQAAQAAYDQILGGADFATVAASAIGGRPDNIGSVTREDLLPAHAEAAFGVDAGATAEPVETALGWMLVHVLSAEGGFSQPLDDVRDDLAEQMKLERAAEELFEITDFIDDLLAGGASLEDASEQVKFPVVEIEPIAETGLNADGEPVAALPSEPAVLTEMYTLDAGQVSTLIQASSERYYFVQVNDVSDSRIPSLDEIETKVQAAWQVEQQLAKARVEGEAVAAAMTDGASAAEIDQQFGYELLDPGLFTRDGGLSGLPASLITDIFAAEIGGVVTTELPEMVIVARVTEIETPNPREDDERWSAALAQFNSSILQDIQAQLAAALRQDTKVSINSTGLEQAFFSQ